jgi:glycosyltransferase involved in cell wall biosynthesis
MRVLLGVHHFLDPNAGAPGLTLALGEGLERRGCEVEYLAFDQVYGSHRRERAHHHARFPWLVVPKLARRARAFDVVDASTGDAWLWATLGRPGNSKAALITRSHGLEHTADIELRNGSSGYGSRLTWKYPIYHGGWRLWEVKRSLLLADRAIFANARDLRYAREVLGVPAERLTVLPYGIREHFHKAERVGSGDDQLLRLAFVGAWLPSKGTQTLVDAVSRIDERDVDFSLTLLGTREDEGVLAAFPERIRSRVRVVASYDNASLPDLLAGHQLLLFPSLSEGSSGAMAEAMACGLAPVATPSGIAPDIIEPGRNGALVPVGDAAAMAEQVVSLAADRKSLLDMRRSAQETSDVFRWDEIVGRTLAVYEEAIEERARQTSRGATARARSATPRP